MRTVDDFLGGLDHRDSRRRDLAAASLGDLFVYRAVDQFTAEQIVARLVELVVAEHHPVVLETAIEAIGLAYRHYELSPLDLSGHDPEKVHRLIALAGGDA